ERHPAQALAVLSLGDCAECGRGTIANQRESLRAAVAWLTAIVSDEGRPDKTTSIADPGPMTVVRHRPDCEGLHSEAPFRRLEPGTLRNSTTAGIQSEISAGTFGDPLLRALLARAATLWMFKNTYLPRDAGIEFSAAAVHAAIVANNAVHWAREGPRSPSVVPNDVEASSRASLEAIHAAVEEGAGGFYPGDAVALHILVRGLSRLEDNLKARYHPRQRTVNRKRLPRSFVAFIAASVVLITG